MVVEGFACPSRAEIVVIGMPELIRSVAFVNARIDSQKGIRMRMRGVAPGVDKAVWWAFHERPVDLELERNGDDAFVVIPSISAWNCGWLAFAH